jgi:hypothetical protein
MTYIEQTILFLAEPDKRRATTFHPKRPIPFANKTTTPSLSLVEMKAYPIVNKS